MRKDKSAVSSSSKIRFDDSDEHESSSEDEEKEIEQELADVTFEELQRARSDGSDTVYRKFNSEGKSSRANKNRPMEMSSKKPVSRFREIIQVPKKATRDPRFESLCGQVDVERFKKRYNFLYEDNLPAEKEELKKQIRKSNDPEEISDLKSRVSWIDKQLKSAGMKHTGRDILAEHKKKEREAVKQGKQPYYLKKSEIRKRIHIKKYEELKAADKVEAYIEKKRRKNASKDHRFLPYRRPGDQENQ